MARVRHLSDRRCLHLEEDIAVQILTYLPDLGDKLAFGSTCQASRRALTDPRSWDQVDVRDAIWRTGRYYSPQRVFSALLPHMPHIRVLEGSSNTKSGSVSFLQATLLRWETFWQCLPNLEHLEWIVPSCALSHLDPDEALDMPDGLSSLKLTILWDHGDGLPALPNFYLSEALEDRAWHERITCLTFETYDDTADHPAGHLHFGRAFWPVLEKLTCISGFIHGSFDAPNLRYIKLDIGIDDIHWEAFRDCQRLKSIHVEGDRMLSTFDCRDCTWPSTLRHLFLSVCHVRENGWFSDSHGLHYLDSVHVSFKVDDFRKVDLGTFAAGSKPMSISIDDGVFDLWMPHQQDAMWH